MKKKTILPVIHYYLILFFFAHLFRIYLLVKLPLLSLSLLFVFNLLRMVKLIANDLLRGFLLISLIYDTDIKL